MTSQIAPEGTGTPPTRAVPSGSETTDRASVPAAGGESRRVACPRCGTDMEPYGGQPDLACPECGFNGPDEDALVLTGVESHEVALLLIARHVEEHPEWLLWENYPNLDEGSFGALVDEVQAWGRELRDGTKRRHLVGYPDAAEVLARMTT